MSAEAMPLSAQMVELLREIAVPHDVEGTSTSGRRARTAAALVQRGFATFFHERLFITPSGRNALAAHDRIRGEAHA